MFFFIFVHVLQLCDDFVHDVVYDLGGILCLIFRDCGGEEGAVRIEPGERENAENESKYCKEESECIYSFLQSESHVQFHCYGSKTMKDEVKLEERE